MIQRETRAIVTDCFSTLDRDHRDVLTLRMDGLQYGEIARRLGVNENTVATRLSRGIRELGRRIRRRMDRRHESADHAILVRKRSWRGRAIHMFYFIQPL